MGWFHVRPSGQPAGSREALTVWAEECIRRCVKQAASLPDYQRWSTAPDVNAGLAWLVDHTTMRSVFPILTRVAVARHEVDFTEALFGEPPARGFPAQQRRTHATTWAAGVHALIVLGQEGLPDPDRSGDRSDRYEFTNDNDTETVAVTARNTRVDDQPDLRTPSVEITSTGHPAFNRTLTGPQPMSVAMLIGAAGAAAVAADIHAVRRPDTHQTIINSSGLPPTVTVGAADTLTALATPDATAWLSNPGAGPLWATLAAADSWPFRPADESDAESDQRLGNPAFVDWLTQHRCAVTPAAAAIIEEAETAARSDRRSAALDILPESIARVLSDPLTPADLGACPSSAELRIAAHGWTEAISNAVHITLARTA